VAGRFTCTNAGFVHEMALAVHGIIRGPSFWLSADVAAGRMVTLLEPWRSTRELPIHALYPHRPLLSAKVRTFVDFLAEWIGSDPKLRAPMGSAGAGKSQ
jgi:DNA-binding transcriptional LysR family regulator